MQELEDVYANVKATPIGLSDGKILVEEDNEEMCCSDLALRQKVAGQMLTEVNFMLCNGVVVDVQ